VTRRIGSILTRLLRRDQVNIGEEREAELHLYAVSQTSTLYLHLQSSWNSFIIVGEGTEINEVLCSMLVSNQDVCVCIQKSTLLLDPLYRRRYTASSDSISWERTAHLFAQLSSELLQDGITEENMYLLLQELRTAAHRNITLRKLFWRTSRCFPGDNFVSVSWILTVLQPHPHLVNVSSEESRCSALQLLHLTSVCPLQLSFIRHQAQQLVQVLSDQHGSILSPVESVLLFQRCRLLLACLQYNNHLDQHLRLHFREEFRLETAVTCDPQSALPPSGKTKYYCRSISKRSPNSNSVT
ncbi:hypothetical protein GOODEAATRI_016711, partial [Goodea atripinnis]